LLIAFVGVASVSDWRERGEVSAASTSHNNISHRFGRLFPPSSLSLEPLSCSSCLFSVPFGTVLAHRGLQLPCATVPQHTSRGSAIISVSEKDPSRRAVGSSNPNFGGIEKIGDILKERRSEVSKWGTMRYVGHVAWHDRHAPGKRVDVHVFLRLAVCVQTISICFIYVEYMTCLINQPTALAQ
jgi:hypothetical protein